MRKNKNQPESEPHRFKEENGDGSERQDNSVTWIKPKGDLLCGVWYMLQSADTDDNRNTERKGLRTRALREGTPKGLMVQEQEGHRL